MIPMKRPFILGRRASVRSNVAGTITAIRTQSGHRLLGTTRKRTGARRWPTTRIVAHVGPSSARICPKASPQAEHLSTGFRYDLKSLPVPQLGQRPKNPRMSVAERLVSLVSINVAPETATRSFRQIPFLADRPRLGYSLHSERAVV